MRQIASTPLSPVSYIRHLLVAATSAAGRGIKVRRFFLAAGIAALVAAGFVAFAQAEPGLQSELTAIAGTRPLPEQIVIGTPGGNRVARHGWIVILAAIPTGQGHARASRFAATARQNGVPEVSVLNTSNRRPLRGGYWVVYTGPFTSLNVSARAGQVRSRGYPTAYIRELIVYS